MSLGKPDRLVRAFALAVLVQVVGFAHLTRLLALPPIGLW